MKKHKALEAIFMSTTPARSELCGEPNAARGWLFAKQIYSRNITPARPIKAASKTRTLQLQTLSMNFLKSHSKSIHKNKSSKGSYSNEFPTVIPSKNQSDNAP
jgi:hypothetical protein